LVIGDWFLVFEMVLRNVKESNNQQPTTKNR